MKRLGITVLTFAFCAPVFAQEPDSTYVASTPVYEIDSVSLSAARELARQDSITRAAFVADSIATARADSIDRVMARVDSLVQFAEDFMQEYRFDKAVEYLSLVESLCPDDNLKSLVSVKLEGAKKAKELVSKAYKPKVVAKEMFSVDDFFLYYPLPDSSWRPAESFPAVYCPDHTDTLYLSKSGPLYPMSFGDRMYFSSNTLSGLGGYDIFRCEWNSDSGEWGTPVNLGFPFNTTADDFLYVESQDGKYSLFTSNRNCPSDSVCVFVLEKEDKWKSEPVTDISTLPEIEKMTPTATPDILDLGSMDNFSDADTKIVRSGAYTFSLKKLGKKVSVVLMDE